jgi:hypothetical protein
MSLDAPADREIQITPKMMEAALVAMRPFVDAEGVIATFEFYEAVRAGLAAALAHAPVSSARTAENGSKGFAP